MALRLFASFLLLAGAQVDDECSSDGCALHVLQRDARRLETVEELVEPFMTEAETKETQNVSMEDLGLDELHRLMGMAQEELLKRGELYGAAPPDALDVTPGEESTEEAERTGRSDAFNGTEATGAKMKSATEAMSCGRPNYYGESPKELCFCKLAGNPGCSKKRCTCPQGCGRNVVWQSGGSVTFKNRARAHGCHPSTVLLTAPKAYYGTPADLKQCSNAVSVIEMLLRDSWNLYQSRVHRGSMNQCFHGSRTASVKYLHLQSFCSYASFHAMPNNNHAVGVCVKMESLSQAGSLARQLYEQME